MAEIPDDNDYTTIVQICTDTFDKSSKQWWIKVALEHKSGNSEVYPDKDEWLLWTDVYDQCIECIQRKIDKDNWLVRYMIDNCDAIEHAVAVMVAKRAKEDMKKLFHGAKFPVQLESSTPVKGKKKKTRQQTKSPVTK